ncbi:MAG: DUF2085 domain-containing protein [Eubacterium sp.]|nr:DUF2085 domain-containing protein [Eubacterium sp.]
MGKVPLCNEKPERAPHIGKFCFPLCWRCTAFAVGVFVGAYIKTKWQYSFDIKAVVLCLIGILPMAIDGILQEAHICGSTNKRRFFTGLLAGISSRLLVYCLIQY